MGFWSSLGNIAGGFFGDPALGDQIGSIFGGNSSTPNTPSPVQGVGQTAADIAKGRAQGRIDQAKLQQGQDTLAQSRAKLALSAPGLEAGNAVRGDVLANGQDATVSGLPSYIHVGQVSGGLRPSMLSASTRALGGVMSRNALANQMSGKDVPDLTPLPASTGLDTGLNATAGTAGFLNALGKVPGLTPGDAGSNVSSTYNPADFAGIDPNTGMPYDGSTSPDTGSAGQPPPTEGIDPALLEWFAKQSVPGGPQ